MRALMDYYKLTTDEIVIIYDDISMPVGQVRIRPKGSAGGHKWNQKYYYGRSTDRSHYISGRYLQ